MEQELWGKISVIGAAGKMGRGIALVILQEMARDMAEKKGVVEGGISRLNLIDANEEDVFTLRRDLKPHIIRYAEKNINALRLYFKDRNDLVSNEEVIHYFTEGALDMVHCDCHLDAAKGSKIVFEAIVEDVDVKDALYAELHEVCDAQTHFFTNTSSIPISLLNAKGRLNHKIIGFHFYNPPPVQKLVEIIAPKETDPETVAIALEVGKRLKKTLVHSRDVAGFIGNGHFIREVAFACDQVERLTKNYPVEMAISIVDTLTRDFLLRPMGIFQLVDYVGIDVCDHIAEIMERHIPSMDLQKAVLQEMLQKGVIGGQNPNGSQKPGFFSYEKGVPANVYSLEKGGYSPISEDISKIIGVPPKGSWKQWHRDPEAQKKIDGYFGELFKEHCLGTELAEEFLQHSVLVSQMLIKDEVATSMEDIDTVLQQGFYHLYGPSYEMKVLA